MLPAQIPKANTGRRLEAKALPWDRSRSHLGDVQQAFRTIERAQWWRR